MNHRPTDTPRKTPLWSWHVNHGARTVEFGGWSMPVQYAGVIEEHRAVRSAAGLFDVSHMGEFRLSGPDALRLVNRVITNDAGRLKPGKVLYAPVCWPDGGIVDDCLVYRLGEDRFMMVVNAANTRKDFEWVAEHARHFDVELEDVSLETGLVACQGPLAPAIVQRITATDLSTLGTYWCREGVEVAGKTCLVSRTGYTGEDGFEIYCRWGDTEAIWTALLDAGAGDGLVPAGLGARDTLRLEARLLLYGNDIDDRTTPLEAGLEWTVKFDKPDFIGKAALQRQQAEGVRRRLAGFVMADRGIPRHGYPIARDGVEVGTVTSGTYSPTLERNIGLGYVPPDLAVPDREFDVLIRGRPARARTVKTPFYRPSRG